MLKMLTNYLSLTSVNHTLYYCVQLNIFYNINNV